MKKTKKRTVKCASWGCLVEETLREKNIQEIQRKYKGDFFCEECRKAIGEVGVMLRSDK